MGSIRTKCYTIEELCREGTECIEQYNDYIESVEQSLSFIEDNIDAYIFEEEKSIGDGSFTLQSFHDKSLEILEEIALRREEFRQTKNDIEKVINENIEAVRSTWNSKYTLNVLDEYREFVYNLRNYHRAFDNRFDRIVNGAFKQDQIVETAKSVVKLKSEIEDEFGLE